MSHGKSAVIRDDKKDDLEFVQLISRETGISESHLRKPALKIEPGCTQPKIGNNGVHAYDDCGDGDGDGDGTPNVNATPPASQAGCTVANQCTVTFNGQTWMSSGNGWLRILGEVSASSFHQTGTLTVGSDTSGSTSVLGGNYGGGSQGPKKVGPRYSAPKPAEPKSCVAELVLAGGAAIQMARYVATNPALFPSTVVAAARIVEVTAASEALAIAFIADLLALGPVGAVLDAIAFAALTIGALIVLYECYHGGA